MSNILVVDIEATCWEGNPPPKEESEIIEIGVILLDTITLSLSKNSSIIVRPTRSKVSPFCTQLTTLTQEYVDQGTTFGAACAILERDYDSRNVQWASYGEYDKKKFLDQCFKFGVRYPFSNNHINVKNLFANTFNTKPMGMDRALKQLNIPLTGTHHRGEDDAYNIGKILAHILRLKQNGQTWKIRT